MEWSNASGWLEYDNIKQPLYSHYGDREIFDKNGNWISSAVDGFDFKCIDDVGYIYHWTDKPGDTEYILRLSGDWFFIILGDFLYVRGRTAIEEYVKWMHREGVIIASRTVD